MPSTPTQLAATPTGAAKLDTMLKRLAAEAEQNSHKPEWVSRFLRKRAAWLESTIVQMERAYSCDRPLPAGFDGIHVAALRIASGTLEAMADAYDRTAAPAFGSFIFGAFDADDEPCADPRREHNTLDASAL